MTLPDLEGGLSRGTFITEAEEEPMGILAPSGKKGLEETC
jgi:hypothetical protein